MRDFMRDFLLFCLLFATSQKEKKSFPNGIAFTRPSAPGVSVQMKLFSMCCDVHMIRDRTCDCCADGMKHTRTWCNLREQRRTGRMHASIRKVVYRI
jgi:hypothetical protein